MSDYCLIADTLAADIAAGLIRPGQRLPPQRDFAYQRGIAVSTASRVYAELIRRGLAAGEVGRGTFVRSAGGQPAVVLAEPSGAPIDLELNFPVLPDQHAILAASLASLLQPALVGGSLRPVGARATAGAREAAARFLAREGWAPDADRVLFTGNGRQAIAASLAALAAPGDRVGVEALTYPIVRGLAARLGIALVPLAMDESGVLPEAIAGAHRAAPLAALYLQPTLHNPLGATMDGARRAEVAALAGDLGLTIIEDAVYSFLADETPLAALAPDCVVYLDSLSKRIAAGLTLGVLVTPPALADRIAAAVRTGAWAASGFPLAAGIQWMADGTAERLGAAKRADADRRQAIAREALDGLAVSGDPRAYHLWLGLPEAWRAEAFAAAALRRGIAVSPGSAFAVSPGYAPNAVRLALASPTPEALAGAMRTLAALVRDGADDAID